MSDESEMERAVEISMGQNSVLLIQSPTILTNDQREHLRTAVGAALQQPGRKCLVLDGGMTAVVLHRDDEADGEEEGGRYLDGSPV